MLIDRISRPENEWTRSALANTEKERTPGVPEFHVALNLEEIARKSHVRLARGALQHVTTILWVPRRVDQLPGIFFNSKDNKKDANREG